MLNPAGKRSVVLPNFLNAPRILDGGIHLQPIADNAFVGQETRTVCLAIARHGVDIKAIERPPKRLPLFEHRQPGKPRLIDF